MVPNQTSGKRLNSLGLLNLLTLLTIISRISLALDSSNKLVDYYDTMTIASTSDPLTDVYTTKLYTFPFVTDVSCLSTNYVYLLKLM